MRTFYESPLAHAEIAQIWFNAAASLGFRVERTREAYATSNGRGHIFVGDDAFLDVDDAVAQLVFHELCHAITQAPYGLTLPDWGLDNASDNDVSREHACLRLQAHLADPHGLRAYLAPTTEYRVYHDALPLDALALESPRSDPAIVIAREAAARAATAPWHAPLQEALAATLRALQARGFAPGAPHALGFPPGPVGETCGSCAWLYVGGRGKPVARCRQAAPANQDGPRTSAEDAACARWERPVDCQTCGACCREAYHSVGVSVRDPVVWRQPHLIERTGHRFEIRREGLRCAALHDGRGATAASEAGAPRASLPLFSCAIYEDRPQTCRDFAAGGRHCLDARRRVGLSAKA